MKLFKISLAIIGFVALTQSCKKDDPKDNPIEYDGTPYQMHIGDFPPPAIAPDNQLTNQGVQLGRMLFYEK